MLRKLACGSSLQTPNVLPVLARVVGARNLTMMLGVIVSCLDLLVSQVLPNSERCHVAAEVRSTEPEDDVGCLRILLMSQVLPNSERCHLAAEVRNREAVDDVGCCSLWIC